MSKNTQKQKIEEYLINNPINRNEKGCYDKASSKFNVDSEYIRGIYRKLREKGLVEKHIPTITSGYVNIEPIKDVDNSISEYTFIPDFGVHDYTENDKREITSKSTEIKSLDDLIQHCNIDLENYSITKHIINKWQIGEKEVFQVKAWLQTKSIPVEENIKDDILEDIINYSPVVGKYDHRYLKNTLNDKYLSLINISDLHFGKLCWHEETGENYDINIAKQKFMKIVEDLAMKSFAIYNLDKILFIIGNDFFHVDNKYSTTTAGTPQDTDVRWQKMFREGRKMVVEAIDYLSGFAPVDVVIVPGNHDEQTSFYLGDALQGWYHNNKNVTVDNSPTLRKYYKYHNNLLGFTHGDKEKHTELPLIMATEAPHEWANSTNREFIVGHLHSNRSAINRIATDEQRGVQIVIMPSIAGTDAWHNGKAYIANKKLGVARIYSKEGLESIIYKEV